MAKQIDDGRQQNSEIIRLLQSNQKCENSNFKKIWSNEEIHCLLKLIVDYDCLEEVKNECKEVFIRLSKLMNVAGFTHNSEEILRFWRDLKIKIKNNEVDNMECYDLIMRLKFEDCRSYKPQMAVIKSEKIDQFEDYDVHRSNGNCRNVWIRKETEIVVRLLEKYGMPSRSNLRKVCCLIVDFLRKEGYDRNEEQVLNKVKQLRALYSRVVRNTISEDQFCYFRRIENLMRNVRTSESEDREIESSCKQISAESMYFFRKGRQIWSNNEISVLLNFIEEHKVSSGKDLIRLSEKAQDYLMSFGYCRSPSQIVNRWKNTRSLYWSIVRKQLKNPENECLFYHRLDSILNPKNSCKSDPYNNKDEETLFYDKDDPLETKAKSSNFSGKDEFCSANLFLENTSSGFSSTEEKNDLISSSTANCANCKSLDSVDHYCISLADNIKKLDSRKQAKLKIEIQKLIYAAEFDSQF